MNKRIALILVIAIVFAVPVPSFASGTKTLEVSLYEFKLIYEMLAKMSNQPYKLTREWISEDQAMLYLTDTAFCTFGTESQSDFVNIKDVLFTAAPESVTEEALAMLSMAFTIYAFDSELGLEFITDLVTTILPQKGEYTSPRCKYKYTKTYNAIMLLIQPR